jgi:hypothetical protein
VQILDPGIIGALLLPVLGALPDSAIVVVSGALSSDPQSQLNVGTHATLFFLLLIGSAV